MRDWDRHGEHNSRQGGNTAGDEREREREREREDRVKEEEGKERSSHRLSIRVYHSSMQCGVWPRPLKTRPERLYHSFLGGLMRTEAISAHVYQLSTMATFLYFIFTFFLHYIIFVQSPSSPKTWTWIFCILSVCLVLCVRILCELTSASVRMLLCVCVCVCVCVHNIYIKEFKQCSLVVLMQEEGQFKKRFKWYRSMNAPDSTVLTVAVSQYDEN